MDLIRPGDRGDAVRDVQRRLMALGLRVEPEELDGTFGPSTERAVGEFQRQRGLPPDGVLGPDTWNQLVESGYRIGDRTLYLRSPAFRGDDVRELQRMLNALGFDAGKEDGIFGARTAEGARDFQRNVGAKVDGIVGLDTVHSLERMRPTSVGPSRAVVREAEAADRMGESLMSSIVAPCAATTARRRRTPPWACAWPNRSGASSPRSACGRPGSGRSRSRSCARRRCPPSRWSSRS
jgi:N-acetylmuramoyl-L-alanine amidase